MKKYFLIMILFFITANHAMAEDVFSPAQISSVNPSVSPLSEEDFTLMVDSEKLKLGELWDDFLDWNDKMIKEKRTNKEPIYIGEVWYNDNSDIYKFYSHVYNDDEFEISTSNLFWDKPPVRDFNVYIISNIIIKSEKYKTKRNLAVGMKVNDIIKAYGKGDEKIKHDENHMEYTLNPNAPDAKTIDFLIESGKIKSIQFYFSGKI